MVHRLGCDDRLEVDICREELVGIRGRGLSRAFVALAPLRSGCSGISVYFMLRNSASGPEIGLPGRILAGLLPRKYQNRPSCGRRADFGVFPVAVRLTSGPEGQFPGRKHYCIT